MNLLIVESPGKINKLKEILGSGWNIKASYGHIRDLPSNELGITDNFEPNYIVIPGKEKVVKELQEAVKQADTIYLATDPDREGEAIAWHLKELLNLSNYKRVTYTSITKQAVLDSINNARTINMALVKAQEARRVLDRFVGFSTTPSLRNALSEQVSAGRVQSPAVRLVVEKERAIRSFRVTQHYGVEALFDEVDNVQDGWKATWKTDNFLEPGQEYILDKTVAENIAKIRSLEVLEYEESENKKAPPAPFTTSTLQQAASQKLKLTPKNTMAIAQRLYEAGLITYMRTDSPNFSDEAYAEIQSYALEHNLPVADERKVWKSKEGSQEAHEAIRPTDITVEDLEANEEEQQLYKLIRERALACVLKDAVYFRKQAKLKGLIEEKEVLFEAKGSLLTDKGWQVIYNDDEEIEESNPIPQLKIGSTIIIQTTNVTTKQTKAPSRYTQATLIRELEKKGIGRPATYASILSNILDKDYIREDDKNKLSATALGEKLLDALYDNFSFIDLDFTKDMEQELDDIAENKSTYQDLVSKTYKILTEEIDAYQAKTAIPCPKCNKPLKHLKGTSDNTGKPYDFFVCESCNTSFNNSNGKPIERTQNITEFTCVKCGANLVHLQGKNKENKPYDFFTCSNKECDATYNNIDGKPVEKPSENKGKMTDYTCKKCGSKLVERPTKTGGIWFPCSNRDCDGKYWAKDDGTPNFDNKPTKKSTTIKAKRK